MIVSRYAGIRDMINRGIFRALLRIEQPDSAHMRTVRHMIAIKSNQDKKKEIRQDKFSVDVWISWKTNYSTESKRSNAYQYA